LLPKPIFLRVVKDARKQADGPLRKRVVLPICETSGSEGENGVLLRMRQFFTVFVYALMVTAILALWRGDAPQFIYVAF
jgi:hypothetical protein